MAIAKKSFNKLTKSDTADNAQSPEVRSALQDVSVVPSGDGELAIAPPPSLSISRLFANTLRRRKKSVEEDVEMAVEKEAAHVPLVRPLDQEKMGWVSPAYTKSRPVMLNARELAANRCIGYQLESPELEFYRVLRTHILQRTAGGGVTVMVTSALPGEGKTLTAINLALTFAREYKQTALLVDCDLRRQRIHEVLGFPSDKGLVDHLIDDCPIQELFVWPGVEKLTVISGGKTVKGSSELLGSPGMKELVADMKSRYQDRYVFFDAPPVLTSADSLAFAPFVDYILLVVQAGSTSMQDVNKALKLLPGEKVLGLVMNR
jgi:non-specific protein-tyrosine kinase